MRRRRAVGKAAGPLEECQNRACAKAERLMVAHKESAQWRISLVCPAIDDFFVRQ
jgi:hypothetical protein